MNNVCIITTFNEDGKILKNELASVSGLYKRSYEKRVTIKVTGKGGVIIAKKKLNDTELKEA